MSEVPVLEDAQVEPLLPMRDAIDAVEEALRARAAGSLVSPPRSRVEVRDGHLTFTVGGSSAVGFRAYGTTPSGKNDLEQITAVWDGATGAFRGVVRGSRLGGLRTGAIGGVALRYLAPQKATTLAMLGSGYQAGFQLEAALAVRPIRRVRVFSPTEEHRQRFAESARSRFGVDSEAVGSARAAVTGADVVICATPSSRPVFSSEWLQDVAHVTSMGGKSRGDHDLEPEVLSRSQLTVTDSLPQLRAISDPPFWDVERIPAVPVELAEIVGGRKAGRTTDEGVTVFLSVGLAGTEVALADLLLQRAAAGGR
jgi:ornithine cyclodeaminase/alanine dehydrogenase-like protein (mu-crystallin family)